MTQPHFTAEEFIQAWQSSDTLEETAKKLGTYKSNCYSRAKYYRNKGVPLKQFPRAKTYDWLELIKLAETSES